jgi:hypothetical protein
MLHLPKADRHRRKMHWLRKGGFLPNQVLRDAVGMTGLNQDGVRNLLIINDVCELLSFEIGYCVTMNNICDTLIYLPGSISLIPYLFNHLRG